MSGARKERVRLGEPVVLIAYHFPPDPAVGSLRAAKVAAAFRAAGHRVEVITARLPGEVEALRVDEPGFRVHAVRPTANPRHYLAALRRRLRPTPTAASTAGATKPPPEDWVPPTAINPWKRRFFSLLWLPDDQQGFILPAVRTARVLLRDGGFVYTTAPPVSDTVAGLLVKWLTGAPWVAELRDPWTDNPGKPPHVRSAASDAIERWLERRCLAAADRIVAVSDSIATLLSAKLPRGCSPVIVARNGIDRLPATMRAHVHADGEPVRVLHAGNLYLGRDPRPFLAALSRLVTNGAVDPRRLRVDLIGDCERFHGEPVQGMIDAAGLADVVHLGGRLPRAETLALLDRADLLLLLAEHQPAQVPNKLYEYLGAGRPILGFVDPEGETARMLARVGGHFTTWSGDPAGAVRAVHDAVSAAGSTWAPGDPATLAAWTTEAQTTHLLTELGLGPTAQRAGDGT